MNGLGERSKNSRRDGGGTAGGDAGATDFRRTLGASWCPWAALFFGLAWLGAAEETRIYSKESPPATPKAEELPLRESVSQYGITWTFEQPARVGQFLNGDYYVVGPVVVKAIDPKTLVGSEAPESELDKYDKKVPREKHVRNGSMLNQPARAEMAYDSGIRHSFKPELLAVAPISMKPGDTLISSISLKLGEKATFVYHSGGERAEHDNCPIKVAAALTCLAEPQPPDAFRPAYADPQRKVYLARNLRREVLPKLEKVEGAPDPVKFAEVFRKPWLNPGFFGFDEPMENMPHYGQWVGEAVGDAGLLLCMDFKPEEKERLLVNFVQVGIDYWGLVKNGHPGWQGWGGHGSGRKFPIVFAGHLLGDEVMACPTKGFPKAEFGEDNQTRYGETWTGAQVVFAGHSGIQSATGKPERPIWGPYEHLPPSLWDKNGQKNMQSEAYRRANTSRCWPAQTLALRILKLEKQWNHDAYLDYMDRWMHEDDKAARKEIDKYWKLVDPNSDTHFSNQGQTGEAWVKRAWEKHRTGPGLPPTDGWKQAKPNPDGIALPRAIRPEDVKEEERAAARKEDSKAGADPERGKGRPE